MHNSKVTKDESVDEIYILNTIGWLIIWDRMFGTFQEEKEDEQIVYGLVDQVNSFNPLYLQVFSMPSHLDQRQFNLKN